MAQKTVTIDGDTVVVESVADGYVAQELSDEREAYKEVKQIIEESDDWRLESEYPDETPSRLYAEMLYESWSGTTLRAINDAGFAVCKINSNHDPVQVKFEYQGD